MIARNSCGTPPTPKLEKATKMSLGTSKFGFPVEIIQNGVQIKVKYVLTYSFVIFICIILYYFFFWKKSE